MRLFNLQIWNIIVSCRVGYLWVRPLYSVYRSSLRYPNPSANHHVKGSVLAACAATIESPPVLGDGVRSEKKSIHFHALAELLNFICSSDQGDMREWATPKAQFQSYSCHLYTYIYITSIFKYLSWITTSSSLILIVITFYVSWVILVWNFPSI
jgi:hypothetical protein